MIPEVWLVTNPPWIQVVNYHLPPSKMISCQLPYQIYKPQILTHTLLITILSMGIHDIHVRSYEIPTTMDEHAVSIAPNGERFMEPIARGWSWFGGAEMVDGRSKLSVLNFEPSESRGLEMVRGRIFGLTVWVLKSNLENWPRKINQWRDGDRLVGQHCFGA